MKESVLAKPREPWQVDQWALAIRWYLRWVENRYESGGEVRTLEERVRMAVETAGARRELALRTRETYGQHAGRFTRWTGDASEAGKEMRSSNLFSPEGTMDISRWCKPPGSGVSPEIPPRQGRRNGCVTHRLRRIPSPLPGLEWKWTASPAARATG